MRADPLRLSDSKYYANCPIAFFDFEGSILIPDVNEDQSLMINPTSNQSNSMISTKINHF